MLISNDVVKDVITKVMRDNKHPRRQDVECIVYRILASIGVDVGGKMAKRTGYIAGVNRSLVMLVQESDGSKIVPLKPGMTLEIATDDYTHPYIAAKVVAAPQDSAYYQAIEGPDIDSATTPVIGSYARTVVQIGVTNPPDKQLSADSQTAQLTWPAKDQNA